MNTSKLKRFAQEARQRLRQGVRDKIQQLGLLSGDARGDEASASSYASREPDPLWPAERRQAWRAARDRIAAHGVEHVVEEVAYTWFNRLMAIRILAKNGLCEPMLEYVGTARVPYIVDQAREGVGEVIRYLGSSEYHEEVISDESLATHYLPNYLRELLEDDTKTEEQFAVLISAFCRLNPIINHCFGSAHCTLHNAQLPSGLQADSSGDICDHLRSFAVKNPNESPVKNPNEFAVIFDLLLPRNILAENGFLSMLNGQDFINDDDFQKPELLGWLYQFYISERKDEVFAKKGKYDADDIAPATQIFTPNWIVKYMVENALLKVNRYEVNSEYQEEGNRYEVNGEYALNGLDTPEKIHAQYPYLILPPAEPLTTHYLPNHLPSPHYSLITYLPAELDDLKVADLACGSGHILVEVFDLLYDLYIKDGCLPGEAVELILTRNITGVDIDTRARQLASFALLLRACQKYPTLARDMRFTPRVYDMSGMPEASQTLGSIEIHDDPHSPNPVIAALSTQYDAIIMNPPYMGSGNMPQAMADYVKKHYPEGKSDLATVFLQVAARLTKKGGRYAFIIPPSWMFLGTFEKLREKMINEQSIDSLLHLSRGVFGADFGASSAVIVNQPRPDFKGTYFRLIERTFQEFDVKHLQELFEKTLANPDFRYKFKDYSKDVESIEYSEDGAKILYPAVAQSNFAKIPGSPIGYWVSDKIIKAFEGQKVIDIAHPRQGIATGDNNRFLRYLWEIDSNKRGITKWVPCSKGGSFRRWYGNIIHVMDWEQDGYEIRNFKDEKGKFLSRPVSLDYQLVKEGMSWSTISSGKPSFRFFGLNQVFETKGSVCFPKDRKDLLPLMGYLNSPLVQAFLLVLSPTMDYHEGPIGRLPYKTVRDPSIDRLVEECVAISKEDWDAHETSWDFRENELVRLTKLGLGYVEQIRGGETTRYHDLEQIVDEYERYWGERFRRLHANETELNRRFIAIYGLEDELRPDVPLSEVTILQQGEVNWEDRHPCLSGDDRQGCLSSQLTPDKMFRRHLPHIEAGRVTQFITFRLADSLPQSVLAEFSTCREAWLAINPKPWTEEQEKEYHKLFSNRMEKYLDNGYGDCVLRDKNVADIMEQTLRFHDGKKYDLLAYVIMSNHIHLVLTPKEGYQLAEIMHSIKSFSASKINKLVGRSGKLWMEESYDRMIRNEDHLNRTINYIWKNWMAGGVRVFDSQWEKESERQARMPVLPVNRAAVMRQLVSYAMGVWMGRYRLDRPGLYIAHQGTTRRDIEPYPYGAELIDIDDDAIIPLLPRNCGFYDNALQRMADFARQVWGAAHQNANLATIEECLGVSLEQYFIRDFWRDHKRQYQNRPIYWLWASKKGAFQVLTYAHRMNSTTAERIRSRYLLPYTDHLRQRLQELTEGGDTPQRELDRLRAQIQDCEEYHQRLHAIAELEITLDLDAGIPANHARFGDVVAKLK